MKRIAAVVATSAVLLLGATGAAHADSTSPPMMGGCGGGYVGSGLVPPEHYHRVGWTIGKDPDSGTLGLEAPRSWSFARTAQGEGRFHDPAAHDLLSLRSVGQVGTPAELMAAQLDALAGTSGLRVVGQHTKVVGSQTWSTLAYRWTSMGEPRTVKERWVALGTDATAPALLVLTVAGRPLDSTALDAVLAHVTPTVTLAG